MWKILHTSGKKIQGTIDYLGFGLMAIWLGTLQLMLDKGQEADWFSATWICWMAVISILALICFIARELSTHQPIVRLDVLRDRNFMVGTMITALYGIVLYGITANVAPVPADLDGLSGAEQRIGCEPSRLFGSIASMSAAGIAVKYIDSRLLLAFGFGILSTSAMMLSCLKFDIAMSSIVPVNILNGFATGFIFVPLTTMTMGRLRREEIGNAAGIYNLMRNIGGSVGIAAITTFLVRGFERHQVYLSQNITPGKPAVRAMLQGLQAKLITGGTDASPLIVEPSACSMKRFSGRACHRLRTPTTSVCWDISRCSAYRLLCVFAVCKTKARRAPAEAPEM